MLDYLRLDGTELHGYVLGTSHRDIARVEGLVGLSGPRGESKPKSEQHGRTNRARWLDAKIPTIEGECWGATIDDAYAQFDEVAGAFYRTLTDPAGKLLQWGTVRGLDLQARVKLAGPIAPPLEEGAAVLRYQVQVEQMDPRAYSQTLRLVVGAALAAGGGGLDFNAAPGVGGLTFPLDFGESSGGVAVVANPGKIETPPVVRVYGPVTSPRYVLDSSALQVKINGELGAGDYLEVDHAKRSVRLNGGALRMNLLDVPNSRFFDVPGDGNHEIQLLAINYGAGAHIEVDTRDAHTG